MKTNNAEKLFEESGLKEKSKKVLDSVVAFPSISPAEAEKKVISYFNSLLANEFALFTKTLNFHWKCYGSAIS